MIDHEINAIAETLQRVTMCPSWHWNQEQNHFETGALTKPLADLITSDFEGLDCALSRRDAQAGRTRLITDLDTARNFIEREAHDRAHVKSSSLDYGLAYLQKNHPKFVWTRTEGGYHASGYELKQQDALIKILNDAGVRDIQPTDVPTNHDGTTHGLFLGSHQIKALLGNEQQAER